MSATAIGPVLGAQLADPFRLALVVGLVMTTLRTRAVTGRVVPLLAGTLFVAVLIPSTLGLDGVPILPQVALGLVSTALPLGLVLSVRTLILRARG